jgi:2'-5' RNA ligase
MKDSYNINLSVEEPSHQWAMNANQQLVNQGLTELSFGDDPHEPKPHITIAKFDDFQQGVRVLEKLRFLWADLPESSREVKIQNIHISPVKLKYVVADVFIKRTLLRFLINVLAHQTSAVADLHDLHLTLAVGADEKLVRK